MHSNTHDARSQKSPTLLRGNTVRLAVLTALAAAGAATAHAQQAPVATNSQNTLQEVVVTGSFIPRPALATPNPVQVVTLAQMKESGFTTTQQVLQQLTANGQGQLSQSFSGAFAEGAAGVALRGLTVGYTLVLIDGHRSAPYPIGDDGQRSFVDVANLPFDAIQRIEVLKDGASATYGSDAIAGVVNIITRKTYQGAQVTTDGGITSQGDGSNYRISGLFGLGDLQTSGHNAYIDLEFRKQNPILFADRGSEYTNYNYAPLGGIDNRYGVPNEQNGGKPSYSQTGYVLDPKTGNIAGFMPGCNAASMAAGQCAIPDYWSQIQPPTKNINALGRFTQKLGDNWQASLEASYFESSAEQVNHPERTQPFGWQGLAIGPGIAPTLSPVGAPTTIPSTNPSFPAGVALASAPLRYNFGPGIAETDSKTYRAVAELNGDLGQWGINVAAGYTEIGLRINNLNYPLLNNLQAALNSATDPFLVGQVNTASVLDFVMPAVGSNDNSKLHFVHAGATRPIVDLGGGPLSVAFGGDYYTHTQYSVAPLLVQEGLYPQGWISNNFTIGKQTVTAGYVELDAPIVKQLDVDLAARYDHYNISGGKTSPKISFKYTPFRQFAVRGTAAKGFRAPGPAENGTAGQTFFAASISDPVLCPNPANATAPGNFVGQCTVSVPSIQSTNKYLKPETSKSFTLGLLYSPFHDISGSIDFYSIEIDDQIVSGGPTTTVRSTNLNPIPQYQANGSVVNVAPPVGVIAYQATGYINANSTKTNGFDFELDYHHRFDHFEYSSEAMWSYINKYDMVIGGTTYHLAGTHGPFIVSGDTGNPRSHVRWSNTVRVGAMSVTGTLSYISSFGVTDPSSIASAGVPQDTCLEALTNAGGAASLDFSNVVNAGRIPNASGMCRVAHFTTFDLYASYDATEHLNLHGSVTNLFDAGAPNDWATYGAALGLVPWNPSMHYQGAVGRAFMVGATLRF